ncbi:LOW QUALITY PROTEIN: probable cytochrome P450 313a3 [Drosophila eugracilis]|uniref:LOW QUALITY PROTEIN: probable cytochrome P450 313a3 n=1 Tax=Drosophila eugracilis TaxID=29029 RepID=UPI001BD99627|nr:LOW QUALITY PROTEIN: probable cytochrome P450 313a3 [Drosophila eugracilis]
MQLPGPKGLPLLGVAAEYIINKRKMSWRTNNFHKYGSTMLCWVGPIPFLITRDPNVVKDILISFECINKAMYPVNAIEKCVGEGLLSLREPQWNPRRKQMNPAFKQSILLSFIPVFSDETNALLSLIDTFVGQGERDMYSDILRWSFGVSIKTTLGSDIEEDENFKNDKLMKSYETVVSLITVKSLMPLVQNKTISKLCGYERKRIDAAFIIDKTIKNVIQKRMNESDLKKNYTQSSNKVINRAIELFRNGDISYEDVKSECSVMVLASFETTALTVWHCLILMAMFPNYQDMAFEELKTVFPTNGDFEVTEDDLQNCEYLDRVLNETMRLIPSIPFIPRETSQDFRLSNGLLIPKGVVMGVDIFNTHRNKDFWGSEANTFNPDNFLKENISERHPYAFIPFSKGRRNCIGWKYALMSSKLALAKVLRNYKTSTSFRYEDLVYVDNMGMKLAVHPRLEFHRRDKDI